MVHIHIIGASGSGTSTLGAAVAEALDILHLDTDRFFWVPTEPPFTTPREVPERLALLQDQALPEADWVLSGSALKWAAPLEPLYDLIVFLQLDPAVRMARIRRREDQRYGDRIRPGGDMAEASRAFLEWAESYDTAGPERRSRAAHEAWLQRQSAPILRLNSAEPVAALRAAVLDHPVVSTGGK